MVYSTVCTFILSISLRNCDGARLAKWDANATYGICPCQSFAFRANLGQHQLWSGKWCTASDLSLNKMEPVSISRVQRWSIKRKGMQCHFHGHLSGQQSYNCSVPT